MDRSKVVVEEINVAAGNLDRRRTVPQDPLEAEEIAAVHEERPRERMAQDVR